MLDLETAIDISLGEITQELTRWICRFEEAQESALKKGEIAFYVEFQSIHEKYKLLGGKLNPTPERKSPLQLLLHYYLLSKGYEADWEGCCGTTLLIQPKTEFYLEKLTKIFNTIFEMEKPLELPFVLTQAKDYNEE